MPDKGDQKNGDGKDDGSKRLTREEYDRLVRGVDAIYFGGDDESEGKQKSLPEKPANEPTKSDDDEK